MLSTVRPVLAVQGARSKERETAAQMHLTRLEGALDDISRRRTELLSDAASAQVLHAEWIPCSQHTPSLLQ